MLASIQHFTKLRRLWLVASKYFKKVSIFHKNEYFWTSCLQTHYYPSENETHWCVFQLYQDSNSRQLVGKAWKLPLSFFAITPLKKVVSVIYQLLNVGLFRNSSQPSISLFLALTFFSLSLEKEKSFFPPSGLCVFYVFDPFFYLSFSFWWFWGIQQSAATMRPLAETARRQRHQKELTEGKLTSNKVSLTLAWTTQILNKSLVIIWTFSSLPSTTIPST